VVGEKEAAAGTVAVRKRSGGEQPVESVEEFVTRANALIASRSLTL